MAMVGGKMEMVVEDGGNGWRWVGNGDDGCRGGAKFGEKLRLRRGKADFLLTRRKIRLNSPRGVSGGR